MSAAVATEKFIDLQIVYNGQPRDYRANVHQTLRPFFERALADFGIQPTQAGQYGLFLQGQTQPLPLDKKIEELGLPEKAVLLLQQQTPPRGG